MRELLAVSVTVSALGRVILLAGCLVAAVLSVAGAPGYASRAQNAAARLAVRHGWAQVLVRKEEED